MGKLLGILAGSIVLVGLALPTVRAQSGGELKALENEVEALKRRQLAVEQELREIKALLRPAMSPVQDVDHVVLDVAGHPAKGPAGAALTLIEFSDFECPFCGRFVRETLPHVERDYVQTGKVRYVFVNFPLEAIHKSALRAAEAALCAGEQHKFWEMHDRLFAHQEALAPADLREHAIALGLDLPRFEPCLASGKYKAAIHQDLAEGEKAGVRATPSFFVGVADPDGKGVKAVKMLRGALPFAAFKETIDSLLAARRE